MLCDMSVVCFFIIFWVFNNLRVWIGRWMGGKLCVGYDDGNWIVVSYV